ncbi:serine/threonine protein kinase US3 [Spheniscid alphaherpesvirus 1]|uniref:non-specific serine/threonine protein kinase n=1 Tax=Spheniscid alphaherpesvirus 1 TaxID=2560777 RepID=A0A1R3TFC9_9ALPH|nr:serine/threonine protein kinase US3 [Spheniscid alphaherpesvirus 1]
MERENNSDFVDGIDKRNKNCIHGLCTLLTCDTLSDSYDPSPSNELEKSPTIGDFFERSTSAPPELGSNDTQGYNNEYDGTYDRDDESDDDGRIDFIVERVIEKRYKILRTLTPGSEGNVYVCKRVSESSKSLVVVKAGQKGGTKKEADMLRSLDHPSIIRLLDVFCYDCMTCLVLPHYSNDLYTYLDNRDGPLEFSDAMLIEKRLLEALSYLHGQGIMHRDVKSENILLNSPENSCLGDFGAACRLTGGRGCPEYYGWAGTLEINSPEMLALDPYCESTDIWSAGVVLFEMLAHRVSLFGLPEHQVVDGAKQLREIIRRLQVHPSEFPKDKSTRLVKFFSGSAEISRLPYTIPMHIRKFGLHMDAEYVMSKMLTFDALHRPSADELLTFHTFAYMTNL